MRRNRPARPRVWWCFAAGVALSAAGDAVYSYIADVLHASPFASPADVLYLASYPVTAAGLLLLIRGRTPGRDRVALIDAAIVSTGLGLLCWSLLMRPVAVDTSRSLAERLVALAYPIGDVLELAMLARLVVATGARTVAYRFMTAALLLTLAGDVAYGLGNLTSSFTDGGWPDAAWLAAYVAWGVAALHPSMRPLSEVAPDRAVRFSGRRLALLAGSSLLAPAVLVVQGVADLPIDVPAIALGSVVLFLLVVARMAGLLGQLRDQTHLARYDPLTGIPNRRTWDEQLARELARARRLGIRIYVAMLDLDHFKRFNDEFGHPAGDRLLKAATAAWRAVLRESDLIARHGGEEFALLLLDCPPEGTLLALERLREVTPLGQSFSAGVAQWDGVESPDELLRRADDALYEAKRAGRDRFVVAAGPSGRRIA